MIAPFSEFSDEWLDQFEARVRHFYVVLNPPIRKEAACLPWAIATLMAVEEAGLPEMGYDFQLQAGTAFWRSRTEELDDGVTGDAYGYEFDETAKLAAIRELRYGNTSDMPELHVWVACPTSLVVMDFTTGFQKSQAERAGHQWTAPDPPSRLVFSLASGRCPDGVSYVADGFAVALATQLVGNVADTCFLKARGIALPAALVMAMRHLEDSKRKAEEVVRVARDIISSQNDGVRW